MTDWQTVRELASAFPEVEESTSYAQQPALRVRKKLFAWMSPHEIGALCVRVDPDEKQLILESNPETYFTTPHYAGYPALLIRFEHIGRDELAERIEDAWLLRAPKRVVDEFLAGA
ncbi:MAG: MmcQ/YjbR family DNA-binding protein [Gaiellaceae bacterium]